MFANNNICCTLSSESNATYPRVMPLFQIFWKAFYKYYQKKKLRLNICIIMFGAIEAQCICMTVSRITYQLFFYAFGLVQAFSLWAEKGGVSQQKAGFVHFCCPVVFSAGCLLGKSRGGEGHGGRVWSKTRTHIHTHTQTHTQASHLQNTSRCPLSAAAYVWLSLCL